MSTHGDVLTERLRLVPIGPARARDLHRVLSDPEVAPWYGSRPSLAEVERMAGAMDLAWHDHGVHKWLAYHRVTGDVVGRGGCSRVPVDADWGRVHAFLPDAPWVREPHAVDGPVPVHAHWVEIGWALRRPYWGSGYATEIGRVGLRHAFTELGVRAVVSCTEPHNHRSRAVMERLGMRHVGEVGGDGPIEGVPDDTRYTVHLLLRDDWRPASVPTT
ncbi:MAG: GNAT family N-acetyltransferase [Actinomycetota bacterium]|nr:GNAT family N-acetyltransferase [Actinomycetota bacterium]